MSTITNLIYSKLVRVLLMSFRIIFVKPKSSNMYRYDSVAHAIDDLRSRGYTEDFNLRENCIFCNGKEYSPYEFEIREVIRFEGDSDPADEAVVYGIESASGVKGVLVNGYGYSSEPMGEEIARRLQIHAHGR